MTQRLKGAQIIGKRLQEARMARGMSVSDLSDLVDVSRQMVTRYESGASSPSPEVCLRMAEVLEVPLGFLSKPITNQGSANAIYFRKSAAATIRLQTMTEQRAKWLHEIVDYIEQYVDLPDRNLPDFGHLERPDDGWNFDVIDSLAAETRKAWGLGNGPISNMTALLENNGIMIGRLNSSEQHLDACSWIDDGRAYILLETGKSAVRERFDLAHELGHLVLHPGVDPSSILDKRKNKQIEDEAHRFASAFLMPTETFSLEAGVPTLSHLQFMKPRWKVSIQAMLYRCHDLDIIDDYNYQRVYRQISARRWNKFEPLDDELPVEETTLLKDSLELIFEHGIKNPEVFLEDILLPQKEVESLCGLARGALDTKAPVVSLKRIK